MEKPREQVPIDLTEVPQPERTEKPEPKVEAKDLEVSELEPRIAPTVGSFF